MSTAPEPSGGQEATDAQPSAATVHNADVVLVAVPVAYVPHVARLLAELDAQQPLRPVPRHRAHRPQERPRSPWPVEELRRLSVGRSETHRTIVAVLDVLATEPGKLFTVEDLAAATGAPRSKVTGAFAGLTRLLKAHFDFDRHGLPFTKVTGLPEGRRKEVYYTAGRRQADRWRQARQH